MTAQCESAAPPPCKRPEVLRPLPAFILEENIPAGGSRNIHERSVGGSR